MADDQKVNPIPGFEPDNPFALALGHDDDLIAVLRGHLHIEMGRRQVLSFRFSRADQWFDFVTFADLVKIARREDLITREMARLLQFVGNLRNSFAHPPIKTELTLVDLSACLKVISDGPVKTRFLDWHSSIAKQSGEQKARGQTIRFAIAYLNGMLRGRIIVEHHR